MKSIQLTKRPKRFAKRRGRTKKNLVEKDQNHHALEGTTTEGATIEGTSGTEGAVTTATALTVWTADKMTAVIDVIVVAQGTDVMIAAEMTTEGVTADAAVVEVAPMSAASNALLTTKNTTKEKKEKPVDRKTTHLQSSLVWRA